MQPPERCRVALEFGDPATVPSSSSRTRLEIDPDQVEQGLLRLVLALVELIRQLMEKQALRRIEAGSLSPEQIDRLGRTLMQLENKIRELQRQFGIDDLNISLGPLGHLLEQ